MNSIQAANILAKWRRFFANWELGSQWEGTNRYKATANNWELLMLVRAEVNGLTKILFEKDIISSEEFDAIMAEEYTHLSEEYSKKYSGIIANEDGLTFKIPDSLESLDKWN